MKELDTNSEIPEEKKQNENKQKLFSKLKGVFAEVGAAAIVTLITSIIGILADVTSLAALASPFTETIRPIIPVIISILTGLMTLFVILYGAQRLAQWRLEDRRQRTVKLLAREQGFFAGIESDISMLLQER
ncbi:MAG: hypothetical protein H8D34_13945 [Chloroflexi bacterium]|nr:hypothetical protein [Chloroflexota bacterium]